MTPELRTALFRSAQLISTQLFNSDSYQRVSDANDASCIPFQLQKLFLLLQTSGDASIETTALTTSFGWDRNDGFQQHDVQVRSAQ